jgi:hypothetical protein
MAPMSNLRKAMQAPGAKIWYSLPFLEVSAHRSPIGRDGAMQGRNIYA